MVEKAVAHECILYIVETTMCLRLRPAHAVRPNRPKSSSKVSSRSLVTTAAAHQQQAPRDMSAEKELLQLSHDLLQSIADRNWNKYSALCDDSLTAFEPEAVGHLVEGLPFHEFYFDLLLSRGDSYKPPQNTISQPHVRMLGPDAAVVSYVRLQQKIDSATGRPLTVSTEETRVWQKVGGKWKNVHFHRSHTTPSS